MKRRVLSVVPCMAMLIAALACNYQPPEYTPPPPQMTSFWSNTQITAATANANGQATETATSSPTASDTPTATITLTSSICVIETPGPGTWVAEVPLCP